MATRTARRPRAITVNLREDIAQHNVLRVDRDKGIIYGVKVLGRTSPNTHGVDGVQGTEYTEEALRRALPIYENLKVNVDHPPRATPNADRSSYDRLGKLVDVRLENEGIFADLHLLKTHPIANQLMEAAERMPDCFGMSHNARGKGTVKGSTYFITDIPEVRSVDVVADAGTTQSLFESRKRPMKQRTLREIVESRNDTKLTSKFARLLEDDEMADTAMDEPEAASSPGYEDHCAEMVKAIILDSDMSSDEKIAKIKKALKLLEDEDTGDDKTTDTEEDEDEEEKDDKSKKKGEKDVEEERDDKGHGFDDDDDVERNGAMAAMRARGALKESKQFRELKTKLTELETKDAVRTLCEAKQFTPTPVQFKALVGLSDTDRKAFIQEAQIRTKTSVPRTAGPRELTESRDQKTRANRIKAFIAKVN